MKYLFLTICAFFLALSTYSQKVEETGERAKQKSEQRLDQKIDQGIDGGLDAIEGLFSKKKKKSNKSDEGSGNEEGNESNEEMDPGTAAMMKMMGGGTKVDVEDSYAFENKFVLHIEQYDKKGKKTEDNEMTMLTKDGSSIMGMITNMEGSDAEIIYDMEAYQMISLIQTEGQKIGTTMALNKEQIEQSIAEASTNEQGEMPTFVKTGNSKEISGYHCEEYKVEGLEDDKEDVEGYYWITTEAETNWMESMAGMSSSNPSMPSFQQMGYPEDGSVIQMIYTDANGEKMVMTVTEMVTDGDFSISTKGYTFMNFGM
jgi:hypothetical protein